MKPPQRAHATSCGTANQVLHPVPAFLALYIARQSSAPSQNPSDMVALQAQQQGDGDKVRALMHISTVMQEAAAHETGSLKESIGSSNVFNPLSVSISPKELEKKASRVKAMLNKLLRIEDENIRMLGTEIGGKPR